MRRRTEFSTHLASAAPRDRHWPMDVANSPTSHRDMSHPAMPLRQTSNGISWPCRLDVDLRVGGVGLRGGHRESARKANAARRPGPFGDLTNDDDRRHRPTGPTDDGSRPIRGGTRWVEERTGRTPRDPGGTNNGGPWGLMCGASNGTTGRFLPEGHMSARRSGHQSDRPPSPRALAAIAEAARRSREAGAGPGPTPEPATRRTRSRRVSGGSRQHIRPAQASATGHGPLPRRPGGRAGGSAGSRAACPHRTIRRIRAWGRPGTERVGHPCRDRAGL